MLAERTLPHPGIFDRVESRAVELAEDIRAILRVYYSGTTWKVRTRSGHGSNRDCFEIRFHSTNSLLATEIEALIAPLVKRLNVVAHSDYALIVTNGI